MKVYLELLFYFSKNKQDNIIYIFFFRKNVMSQFSIFIDTQNFYSIEIKSKKKLNKIYNKITIFVLLNNARNNNIQSK